jgi:hypothetical protein
MSPALDGNLLMNEITGSLRWFKSLFARQHHAPNRPGVQRAHLDHLGCRQAGTPVFVPEDRCPPCQKML